MSRVFSDYAEVNEKILEGFTVVKATTMINGEGSGLWLELERKIDGGIIGIDICYDPEISEAPFTISHEYLKQTNS